MAIGRSVFPYIKIGISVLCRLSIRRVRRPKKSLGKYQKSHSDAPY